MTGDGARDPPGEVVRLRARVDEHDRVERPAGRRDEPLGDLERGLVQVALVRVQPSRLADDRLDDARVPVAYDRDVVVRVEIAPSVGGDQPDALAAHEMERVAIGQPGQRRPEHPRATIGEGRHGHSPPRLAPAEPSRDLLPADRVEQREERRRLAAEPGLERVRVVVQRGPRGRHHDRGAHPGREQLAEDRPLPGLEWRHPLVAVEHQPNGPEGVVSVAPRDRGLGDGHRVDHERRVARIAEVDDPGHLAVFVDEHVRGAQVRVDDLRAEPGPGRRDDGLVAVQGVRHEPADGGVRDRVEHRPQPERVLGVPQHHPPRGRVPEPAQRPPDARRHRTPVAERLVAQRVTGNRGTAGQPVVQPDMVLAVRARDDRPERGRIVVGQR